MGLTCKSAGNCSFGYNQNSENAIYDLLDDITSVEKAFLGV